MNIIFIATRFFAVIDVNVRKRRDVHIQQLFANTFGNVFRRNGKAFVIGIYGVKNIGFGDETGTERMVLY